MTLTVAALGSYVDKTRVPVEASKGELRALLLKHGADHIVLADDTVAFTLGARRVWMRLELLGQPSIPQPRGWLGWTPTQREAWVRRTSSQLVRQQWRATLLIIKAKLELVALGGSTVEREFLADIVMPDGSTVWDCVQHRIDLAYASGQSIQLME